MQPSSAIPPVSITPEMSIVLCYGHDSGLLKTRQWLLEQLGSGSGTVTNALEYRAFLHRSCPAVIVLCQTLSEGEKSAAQDFAAERCPDAHLLVMFNGSETGSPEPSSILFDAQSGPRAFSQTISRLVQQGTLPGPQSGESACL